jgi:hypothetical protein
MFLVSATFLMNFIKNSTVLHKYRVEMKTAAAQIEEIMMVMGRSAMSIGRGVIFKGLFGPGSCP